MSERPVLKMFAVLDKKAGFYHPPQIAHSKADALRTFHGIVNGEQSQVTRYPSDFSLWIIGEWDQFLGVVTAFPKPEFLEEAINCVKTQGAPDNGKIQYAQA